MVSYKAASTLERGHTMSALIYLASDSPLKSIEYQQEKWLSINEALALGIQVPDYVLSIEGLDRDKPYCVCQADSDDDLSIFPIEKSEDLFTTKTYCSKLEWGFYTPERAERVIDYIKEHLEHTAEMEIWHIWLGSSYPPPHIKRTKLPIHALDTDTIKRLDELTFSTQSPLTGSITILKDWELSEEDIARDTQYCYVIVRDP